MSLRNQLLASYPSNINKTSENFSALVTNEKGTGVFESVMGDLLSYMKEWYSTPSIYDQTDEQLERTIAFFTYITRFTDETDKSLKNRIAALFIRNHDESWGSKYNIKRIFEQYFPSAVIYVIENSYNLEESLLKEGDFISKDLTYWTTNNVEIDKRARFSKNYGAVLKDNTSLLSQTVQIHYDPEKTNDKAFYLHFYCLGKCSVEVMDNNGRYWNKEKELWQSTAISVEFETEEWEDCGLWFTNFKEGETRIVDSSITSVTLTFKGNEDNECYVDYVRFFEKKPYPSFSVIAYFTTSNTFGSLALFKGEGDPVEGETETAYDNAGYYNQVYMAGVSAGFAQDIYQDLLDYVRATGVKANIEIVSKDMGEGD